MRLSDIRGERVLDVAAALIAPAAEIAMDETAGELFRAKSVPEGMSTQDFLLERVKRGLPALLRDKRRQVVEILAAIEGAPVEDYLAGLTMEKLAGDCVDLLTDEAFRVLFISAQTGRAGGSCGSARESTGEG